MSVECCTNDPNQINGYDYAGNNPTSSADPTGLIRDDDPNGGNGDVFNSKTIVGKIPVTTNYNPFTGNWTTKVGGVHVTTLKDNGDGKVVPTDFVVLDPYAWAHKVAAQYAAMSIRHCRQSHRRLPPRRGARPPGAARRGHGMRRAGDSRREGP